MVTPDARVAIIGAGPHGLAAALHLLAADPTLRDGLVAVDPAGGWLRAWHERFARLGIGHLRSPAAHHPGCEPPALHDWARRHGDEPAFRSRSALPSTAAFRAFCDHLVEEAGIGEHIVPTRAHRLDAGDGTATVVLADGTELVAEHVVVATDPARRCLPAWVFDALPVPPNALAHADDVDLRRFDGAPGLDGEDVVVVGGGLTAGHLAAGAVDRGATVTLVCRRPVREAMFDTDGGWLGPKHLDGFAQVPDVGRRVGLALAARDGGSMPPWMARRLHAARDAGRLRIVAPERICGAQRAGDRLSLTLGDESRLAADRVSLATGTRPDVAADRLTAGLLDTHPVPVHDGWPALGADLRWPGTTVHVLGRLAMPVLGPAAGNLWGARLGAARVAAHIVGHAEPEPHIADHWSIV